MGFVDAIVFFLMIFLMGLGLTAGAVIPIFFYELLSKKYKKEAKE